MTKTQFPDTKSIYPQLDDTNGSVPSAPPPHPNHAIIIQDFRVELLKEKEKGEKHHKDYKKLMNSFHNVEMCMSSLTVALGATGIGVLVGVATIPIRLALEAASGVCGILGVLFNRLQKKYEKKSRKHDEIRVLAVSKLDLILGMYNKMVANGEISDQEYETLRKEMASFREMKKSICNTKTNE